MWKRSKIRLCTPDEGTGPIGENLKPDVKYGEGKRLLDTMEVLGHPRMPSTETMRRDRST